MLSFCCLPFRVKVDGTIPFLPGMMKPTLGIVPTFTSIQRERAWVLLRNMQSLTVFFGNDIGSTQIVVFSLGFPFKPPNNKVNRYSQRKTDPYESLTKFHRIHGILTVAHISHALTYIWVCVNLDGPLGFLRIPETISRKLSIRLAKPRRIKLLANSLDETKLKLPPPHVGESVQLGVGQE